SVVAKQLETLHVLIPQAAMIGCLVNPNKPDVGTGIREAQEAARTLGLSLYIVNAGVPLTRFCRNKIMPDAIELLSTRSSFKAVELKAPGPSAAEIDKLLSIACRVPDHGKLTPWRFIVFEDDARLAAGGAIATAFRAIHPD